MTFNLDNGNDIQLNTKYLKNQEINHNIQALINVQI